MVVISGATLFFAVKEKEKEFHFLVFTAAPLTLSFVFGELFRRLSLLSEEFKHKRTRYQGKWKGIFKTTFTFDYGKCILVAAIASALILCYQLYEQYEVFSPRFRHFVFSALFRGSAVAVPCGSPTALSCGNVGFERKRKQECGWWAGLELLLWLSDTGTAKTERSDWQISAFSLYNNKE